MKHILFILLTITIGLACTQDKFTNKFDIDTFEPNEFIPSGEKSYIKDTSVLKLLHTYVELRRSNKIVDNDLKILSYLAYQRKYLAGYIQTDVLTRQESTFKNDNLRKLFSEPTTKELKNRTQWKDFRDAVQYEGYWLKIVNPFADVCLSICIELDSTSTPTISFKQYSIGDLPKHKRLGKKFKSCDSKASLIKIKDKKIKLTIDDWLSFTDIIREKGFWSIKELENDYGSKCKDIYYILEGFRTNRSIFGSKEYNLLEKYDARGDPIIWDITLSLLELSGEKPMELFLIAGPSRI